MSCLGTHIQHAGGFYSLLLFPVITLKTSYQLVSHELGHLWEEFCLEILYVLYKKVYF